MGQSGRSNAKRRQTVSRVLADGRLVELVYDPDADTTGLIISGADGTIHTDGVNLDDGTVLTPVPATNNLICHRAILLPTRAADYDDTATLLREIEAHLHRYLDLTPAFERIAAYYVLLTWLYDRFNEVPYLRFVGDYGTGKTRALTVVGSICYKAFFASGASTVSPIFHTLDAFRGTLVLDEADFRFSDEKAELSKVLNNGHARGFPVLRSVADRNGTFDPRAFHVFGPKIVATRGDFEDEALESRFLTEEMGGRRLRSDIPINLPEEQAREAEDLRNKLLRFRFRNHAQATCDPTRYDPGLEPRLNQVLTPLLSLVGDAGLRDDIRRTAATAHAERAATRSASPEGHVVAILLSCLADGRESGLPVAEVTERFATAHGADYERPITNRWVGGIVRKGLRLATYKTGGVYVIPPSQFEKIRALADRYRAAPVDDAPDTHGARDMGT